MNPRLSHLKNNVVLLSVFLVLGFCVGCPRSVDTFARLGDAVGITHYAERNGVSVRLHGNWSIYNFGNKTDGIILKSHGGKVGKICLQRLPGEVAHTKSTMEEALSLAEQKMKRESIKTLGNWRGTGVCYVLMRPIGPDGLPFREASVIFYPEGEFDGWYIYAEVGSDDRETWEEFNKIAETLHLVKTH